MVGDNKYASTIITLLKINILLENWKGGGLGERGWRREGTRETVFLGWPHEYLTLRCSTKLTMLLRLSLDVFLFCLSLLNGLWCNEDVGHCGSGLFWACHLSFGLLCYSLSAHESISSTEISFNLGAQRRRAACGALGGSTIFFF